MSTLDVFWVGRGRNEGGQSGQAQKNTVSTNVGDRQSNQRTCAEKLSKTKALVTNLRMTCLKIHC